MVYVLGAVKPNVKKAADDVGQRFSVSTIYGVAPRDGESDHPKGLALDFMTYSDLAKGDAIANYMQTNAGHYGVTYIIWKQHIWNVGRASEGWRAMEDRGSATANHMDHVHVSFKNQGGNSLINIVSPIMNLPGKIDIPNPLDPLKDLQKAGDFITDSHNWYRVGLFTLGGVLIVVALIMLAGGQATTVATAVGKAVPKKKPRMFLPSPNSRPPGSPTAKPKVVK